MHFPISYKRVLAILVGGSMLCLLPAASLYAQFEIYDMSGKPEVIDGNTLKFRTATVRLLCVSAPKSGQPYAEEASQTLQKIIGAQPVHCVGRGNNDFGSVLAFCKIGQENINQSLIGNGFASVEGGYKCNAYKKAALKAKNDKIGMWADPKMAKIPAWQD